MERGWVKLHRRITEWEWFTDPATAHLFIYLLAKANRKPTRYKGVDIPAGGLTTSRAALAKATGLSEKQVRTAINHLISTNEVAKKSTRKYTLLIVKNFELYQGTGQDMGQQGANRGPTEGQQGATNKKSRSKEVKNDDFYSSSAAQVVEDAIDRTRTEFGEAVANAFGFFIGHWDAKPPDASELAEWIEAIRSRPTTVERLEMLEYSSGSNAGGKWYRRLFTDRTVPKTEPEQSHDYDAWTEKMLRMSERRSNESS